MAKEEKSFHEEGSDTANSLISQEPVREIEDLHFKARRRLIQVGLMSLPVLMTVRSRPAFAQSLGSVAIPYGAYLLEKVGDNLVERPSIPIKVNEYGEPIDANGDIITFTDPNDYLRQEIMVDPTRRTGDTVNYQLWINP